MFKVCITFQTYVPWHPYLIMFSLQNPGKHSVHPVTISIPYEHVSQKYPLDNLQSSHSRVSLSHFLERLLHEQSSQFVNARVLCLNVEFSCSARVKPEKQVTQRLVIRLD